jgi:hypothetical protein
VAAIADMNNDGHEDLIWENSSTGVRGVWLMDGPDYIPSWLEIGQVGTDWHIAAVNDFTGDGKPDILWQSDAGVRGIWQMDGTMFTGNWFGLGQVDPAWDIADAADVTGDGRPDIIWQNLSNGSRGAWPMNGATPTGAFLGMGVVDGAWTIAAMGDFTGDNKPDLIWRNTSNGSTVIWAMNGVNYAGSSYSLGVVPPDWNLAGLLGANLCGMSTFLVDGSPGTGSLSNTDCQLNGRAADNYSFYLEQQTGARITLNASTIRYQMSIYHDYVSPSTFVGAWVLDNASTAETFQSILPAGYYVARVIAATAGETGSYNVTTTTFDENIGNCNGVFVTPVVATVQRLEATDCPTPANDGTRFDEFTQFMQAGHTYTVHAARNGGSLNVEIWRLDSMVSQNIDPSGNVSFSFTPTESGYYAIDVIANPGTGTIPYFLQIQ